ncbi:MAG: hypothetical protein CMJ20_04855 [Phycisphaeraceae bacterium]|nr:hypothetical protein [Phycisphaeraceae bacterium]
MHANPDASATAVLDVGKTHVKLLVVSRLGSILDESQLENEPKPGPPYQHIDTERIWNWLQQTIAATAKKYQINSVVATTHGAAAALVDDDELVLPILDYETIIPPDEEFEAIIPPFNQTQSPDFPDGLNLGRQLFWLQKNHPVQFTRARYILTYPQYWAWRLCGVPASEVTSLGCHTHLWNPGQQCFSTLVQKMGWQDKFPPMHHAAKTLGTIKPQLAGPLNLSLGCRVHCGIHDSNGAYCLYLRGHQRPFSLISTGTWIIMMSPRLALDQLEPSNDTLALVNILGEPLPTARLMGGREFEILTSRCNGQHEFDEEDLASIVKQEAFLLPTFATGGPFADRKGPALGPNVHHPGQILARATLYVAMMTMNSTELLKTDGDLIIDGGFAQNLWYCRLLAALRPHGRCYLNHQAQGTAIGTGMLPYWDNHNIHWPLDLTPVQAPKICGLDKYVQKWRMLLENPPVVTT